MKTGVPFGRDDAGGVVQKSARGHKGKKVRRCEGAKVRRCEGAKVRRCEGAKVRRCEGAKVRRDGGKKLGQPPQTSSLRTAQTAAWVRSETPILRRMCCTCSFTVS